MTDAVQTPRIEARDTLLVAGLAERFNYEAISDIPDLWQRFVPLFDSVAGRIGYVTYGVVFNPDVESFEYLAGVEVASLDAISSDLRGLRIPAQTYAVFVHRGHISGLRATMSAIWSVRLPASAYESVDAPVYERYDDAFNPKTGEGEVEIWIPVRPRPSGG
jgi:AraC family transcriptional regulator